MIESLRRWLGWSGSIALHASLLLLVVLPCDEPLPPARETTFVTTLGCEDEPLPGAEEEFEVVSESLEEAEFSPVRGTSFDSAIGLAGGAGGAWGVRGHGRKVDAVGARPAVAPGPAPEPERNTEGYDRIDDNPFRLVASEPLSTFSIDVDTASYSNVRRFLRGRRQPPPDAVRIEELVNYFPYEYEPPAGDDAFASHVRVASCPWEPEHRLVRLGLKGREIAARDRPASNLVFLIDVSGSMQDPMKLPLVQQSLNYLVEKLRETDRIAIVVYAGASGLVLPSTAGDRRRDILAAITRLTAGGSTNGAAGISLAYRVARDNAIEGGINRVILATDGDFNVGVTDRGSLTRLIEEEAKRGVFLSVLGFGMGNYKDSTLESLADRGNGNYAYIDSFQEARKVLGEEMSGTLFTIAKDVKIQVEFNPARVAAYRLIGYENRVLAHQDFKDDRKDAGDIGAGHTVTALYEFVPAGRDAKVPGVDPLKYQRVVPAEAAGSDEILTLKLRAKDPGGSVSRQLEFPVVDEGLSLEEAGPEFRFAAAVAEFGMLLRRSEHRGNASFEQVLELARSGQGTDRHGYRAEFLELVELASRLR